MSADSYPPLEMVEVSKDAPGVTDPLNGTDSQDAVAVYSTTTSSARNKRESFAKKLQAISMDKPPTKNPLGFIGDIFGLCCAGTALGIGCCCCIGLLVVLNVIPIASIVIGILYWDTDAYCTAENIPLILVVGGGVKVIHVLFSTSTKRRKQDGGDLAVNEVNLEAPAPEQKPNACVSFMNGLLSLADLAWLITASIFVYKLYPHVNYEKELAATDDYCDKTLFQFAFWYVTFFYILFGIIILLPVMACCCGICFLCCSGD